MKRDNGVGRGLVGALARFHAPAALAIAAACSGCNRGDKGNEYAPPPPPEVVVANPVKREVTAYSTYSGTVQASDKVDIRARVEGFLKAVHFEPGQRVEEGQLLFEIDPREFKAAVDQAAATVESAQATFELAVTTLDRAQQAFDLGGTSDLELREKKAARDEAKAALDLTKARLETAQLNLQYCSITSPITGRITDNFVDIGNLVGRNESTLLAQIVRITPVYVPVEVSEADVLKFRRAREAAGNPGEPGQIAPGVWRPSELSLGSENDFTYKGRVDYVEPKLNPETGTLRVRTEYENADESLLPGLFGRVRFALETADALVVPEAALLSDQQGRFALVVNAQDEVEVRRVEIGALDQGMRVVTSGLTPEDRVIVLGVLRARPGAKVTPKTQEPAASGR